MQITSLATIVIGTYMLTKISKLLTSVTLGSTFSKPLKNWPIKFLLVEKLDHSFLVCSVKLYMSIGHDRDINFCECIIPSERVVFKMFYIIFLNIKNKSKSMCEYCKWPYWNSSQLQRAVNITMSEIYILLTKPV